MGTIRFPLAYRGGVPLGTTLALLGCLVSLIFAAVALASTDFYASSVGVSFNEGLIDTRAHFITTSYAHNLNGGGSCAGAYEYANFVCTGSESAHPYEGTHNLHAELANPSSFANFNGHADY
jgi:hypothetical protein